MPRSLRLLVGAWLHSPRRLVVRAACVGRWQSTRLAWLAFERRRVVGRVRFERLATAFELVGRLSAVVVSKER